MLKNTLCNVIENLILQYQLTPYQQERCKEYFSFIKKDDFIYAGTLKAKIAVDIGIAYKILENLKSLNYLVNIFEVYCFDDSKSKGIFLESLADFNEDMYCDFCGKELTINQNIIVLYKVINV